jgi:hypothetical protein
MDREVAEGALERNLLTNKIIRLFPMQALFSSVTSVTHNLKKIAILKLPKPALCPLAAMMTQPLSKRGMGGFGTDHGDEGVLK